MRGYIRVVSSIWRPLDGYGAVEYRLSIGSWILSIETNEILTFNLITLTCLNIMNSLEARIFVQSEVTRVWREYQALFNCGAEPPVEFTTRAVGSAGFAYYSGKVSFNLTYICSHESKFEHINTIAHELAHIVQYRLYPRAKQGHGPEFKQIMILAGYCADTYHHMSKAKAKLAEKKIKDESILLLL